MSSAKSRKKKNKPIEWVTVTFKGKKIAVSHDTEAERILGTKDGDMVREGKKAIFLNGLQVNPSALIEKDCLMEVRAVRPKRR